LDFDGCLKVDTLSRQRLCTGGKFQVDGAETEKALEEKLLVMPDGLAHGRIMVPPGPEP